MNIEIKVWKIYDYTGLDYTEVELKRQIDSSVA